MAQDSIHGLVFRAQRGSEMLARRLAFISAVQLHQKMRPQRLLTHPGELV
jgi:hypothetical protein